MLYLVTFKCNIWVLETRDMYHLSCGAWRNRPGHFVHINACKDLLVVIIWDNGTHCMCFFEPCLSIIQLAAKPLCLAEIEWWNWKGGCLAGGLTSSHKVKRHFFSSILSLWWCGHIDTHNIITIIFYRELLCSRPHLSKKIKECFCTIPRTWVLME